MLTRRALPVALAAAALELSASPELFALPSRELFTLGRSKNANVVKYAVRTGQNGRLNPAEPVEAYWLMLAENGRREELTWTELRQSLQAQTAGTDRCRAACVDPACRTFELRAASRLVSGDRVSQVSSLKMRRLVDQGRTA